MILLRAGTMASLDCDTKPEASRLRGYLGYKSIQHTMSRFKSLSRLATALGFPHVVELTELLNELALEAPVIRILGVKTLGLA
jgi:hypothetical protein